MNIIKRSACIADLLTSSSIPTDKFAVAAGLAALLMPAYSILGGLGCYSGATESYKNQMVDYQAAYDWQRVPAESSDPAIAKSRLATITWDDMQKTTCCGLNGPGDWNRFRPTSLPQDLFPGSCCNFPRNEFQGVKYCTNTHELFKEGCLTRTDYQWHFVTEWSSFLSVAQLAFSALALYIAEASSRHLSASQHHIVIDLPPRNH